MDTYYLFSADAHFRSKKCIGKLEVDSSRPLISQLYEALANHVGLTVDPEYFGHIEYFTQACPWYVYNDMFGEAFEMCSVKACKPRIDIHSRRKVYRFNVSRQLDR